MFPRPRFRLADDYTRVYMGVLMRGRRYLLALEGVGLRIVLFLFFSAEAASGNLMLLSIRNSSLHCIAFVVVVVVALQVTRDSKLEPTIFLCTWYVCIYREMNRRFLLKLRALRN